MRHDDILERIIRVAKVFLNNRIISIILFGSRASGEACKSSDYDVLLIVPNDIEEKTIKVLKNFFITINSEMGWTTNGLLDKILRAIEARTGMFISGFICTLEDFMKKKFHKIFGTSRFMSKLLAPTQVVFRNVLRNYKVLIGKDIFREIDEKEFINYSYKEILKSFLMNLLLAMGAFFISFKKESSSFSLESIKWSLMTLAYAADISPKLGDIIDFLIKNGYGKIIRDFIMARRYGIEHVKIALEAPWVVLKIHLFAMKMYIAVKSRR